MAVFGNAVKGLRGPDSQVRALKDVGEYDLYSAVCVQNTQAGELRAFAYGASQVVPATAVPSTAMETNMRTPGQLVDESMLIYGVAIKIHRMSPAIFQAFAADYVAVLNDFLSIECHTYFTLHVSGDKHFAEGHTTWFGEGGGISGFSVANNAEILNNNVPTHGAIRRWEYKLALGRINSFYGSFMWPNGAPAIALMPGQQVNGRVLITTRLVGVRARKRSFSVTTSRVRFGSSMPTTDLPGIRATRTEVAESARARSSCRPSMRFILMPGASSYSYIVITGPGGPG